MEENIIKIFDGLYVTSSYVSNDRYKYVININNKTIEDSHERTFNPELLKNINVYMEEILLSSSIKCIDYDTTNNFILDALKNKEKVIIYDDNNFIVSFLICSIFMIKVIKINYFDVIAWLKHKLKINSKIYKKLTYQLLLQTC
jgi:hypothetical protein